MSELSTNTMSNTIDKYIIIIPLPMLSVNVYNWKFFFKAQDYVLLGSCPEIPYWKQLSLKISGYVTFRYWICCFHSIMERLIVSKVLNVYVMWFGLCFNWDSLHAKVSSHNKAWSYKKNKHKKIKSYRNYV